MRELAFRRGKKKSPIGSSLNLKEERGKGKKKKVGGVDFGSNNFCINVRPQKTKREGGGTQIPAKRSSPGLQIHS